MENRKSIVVCGDSFSIGIGCRNLDTEPYGSLLSRRLDKPLINLAKGSSTNFSIFLQAKYAVEKLKDRADLVLVSNTSYDRLDWFPLDYQPGYDLGLEQVNYHQYPPYGDKTYLTKIDHPMCKDAGYVGKMFTDNIRGIIDYYENFQSKNNSSTYYERFKDEPRDRMKLLYEYSASIHNEPIDRLKSIGSLTMAHQLLKKADINHLILTHEVEEYSKYIDTKNLVHVSWSRLSLDYPDDLPTLHTSPEGHRVAYNQVMNKLISNGWTYGRV